MDKYEVDNEVKRLILQAKGNDITNEEINKCLENAYQTLAKLHKKPRGKCLALLGWFCKLSLCATLFVALSVVVATSSTDAQKIVGPFIIKHIPDVTKPFRRLAIFLTQHVDRFEWYKWHSDGCLIDNPYKAQQVYCQVCMQVNAVVQYQNIDAKTYEQNIYNRVIPFKVHSNNQIPVSFTKIQENYETYANSSKMGLNWIKSTSTDLTNVTVFMQEMTESTIATKQNFHAEWHMKRAGPSAFLRKFFPIPNFIPSSAQMSLRQVLTIDSAESPAQEWPESQHESMVYVQGYGEREIHFTPHKACADMCKDFSITMTTGDILSGDASHWKLETRPVSSTNVNDELSIALIRSIQWKQTPHQ